MRGSTQGRLVFMANANLRLMVIRPIGPMAAADLIGEMFARIGEVEAPWRYDRAVDLRRFEGELSPFEIDTVARRWKSLRGKNRSFSHVAMIRLDACRQLHRPGVLMGFPDETICRFTSYNVAYGWLSAGDRSRYLDQLTSTPSTACARPRGRQTDKQAIDLIDV